MQDDANLVKAILDGYNGEVFCQLGVVVSKLLGGQLLIARRVLVLRGGGERKIKRNENGDIVNTPHTNENIIIYNLQPILTHDRSI